MTKYPCRCSGVVDPCKAIFEKRGFKIKLSVLTGSRNIPASCQKAVEPVRDAGQGKDGSTIQVALGVFGIKQSHKCRNREASCIREPIREPVPRETREFGSQQTGRGSVGSQQGNGGSFGSNRSFWFHAGGIVASGRYIHKRVVATVGVDKCRCRLHGRCRCHKRRGDRGCHQELCRHQKEDS